MTIRFQRLLLILISLFFLSISITLILINSKKNIIFFYTPTELFNSNISVDENVRIGGFVMKNSIKNLGNNKFHFILSDSKNFIEITHIGILPDLFKEGQGAVVQGILLKNKTIKAEKVFAKHDENYMPKSIKKQLEKNEYWKNNYE